MLLLDQQLHGYRHGHQLLSSSRKLPKRDQELIDRLSDVAGPLSPGERFPPYLTCYPLPSGLYYVLARTWQDFEVPRAGCVRTRSLIIPMEHWVGELDIVSLVEKVSGLGPTTFAEPIHVTEQAHPLPTVEPSQALELVEALFLEDRKPIAVFNAHDPEGITIRLLTAIWPALRVSFSAITFALSPRTVSNRSFDLVFAPPKARSRFGSWDGRRIDALKASGPRHRWSNELLDRVFGGGRPSLFRDDVLSQTISEGGATEADLRVSLLWNELEKRLEASPKAALGLLDIASSRPKHSADAIRHLEPGLGHAARLAVATLPTAEAWSFLVALTSKLQNVRIRLSATKAIRGAAVHLTRKSPLEAISTVKMIAQFRGSRLLLNAIGDALAKDLKADPSAALARLQPEEVLNLLLASHALAAAAVSSSSEISARLAQAIADALPTKRKEAKRHLLPLLVDDHHSHAAGVLISEMDEAELVAEAKLLERVNGLKAESLHEYLVERARAISSAVVLRDAVATLSGGSGTDALLSRLIDPTASDLVWLLTTPSLTVKRRAGLLRKLIESASGEQLRSMVPGQLSGTLNLLLLDLEPSLDLVEQVLIHAPEPSVPYVEGALHVLPHLRSKRAEKLAAHVLCIILPEYTGSDRDRRIATLLDFTGRRLDGGQLLKLGLARRVPGELVASNLLALNGSSPAGRERVLAAAEQMAEAIVSRGQLDFSEQGVRAAAEILWDSASIDFGAFVRASGKLMPFLLRARSEPASPLIAAAFPPVYHELRKSSDAPDLFRFFLFVDWDKCKVARNELVDAFMKSTWRATDIALAAARAGDALRILRRISTRDGGGRALQDVAKNLTSIPEPWQREVREVLADLDGHSSINDRT